MQLLSILICLLLLPATAAGEELRVGKQQVFKTIRMALNAARPGTRIVVESGTYHEHLVIKRAVHLVGQDTGGGRPIIDGSSQGTVLTLAVDGIAVEGFTIRGSGIVEDIEQFSGHAGILVQSSENRIIDNRIEKNSWGLILKQGSRNIVQGNTITGNSREGILLMDASDNSIENNGVMDNFIGITVRSMQLEKGATSVAVLGSNRNNIHNNTVDNNQSDGISLSGGEENRVTGNRVTRTRKISKQLAQTMAGNYGISVQDLLRGGDGSGIALYCFADRNRIESNQVTNNEGPGIELQMTHNNSIGNNRITENETGILVSQSTSSTIKNNSILDNREYGIRIERMVKMPNSASGSNVIFTNDLQRNAINAFDASDTTRKEHIMYKKLGRVTSPYPESVLSRMASHKRKNLLRSMEMIRASAAVNQWDHEGRGNHYDNFDEAKEGFVDSNRDGIGETGYAIPGGSATDRYPLKAVR